ncbi:MAG: HlyD family efflux transporter periplasmic adaptor subunit [Acidobacteria bacterium]|nr:HlyD family efflux transporter periplasmic adaptor subunit [Acidobacteriota bacterium]
MKFSGETQKPISSPWKKNLGRLAALALLVACGVLLFLYRGSLSSRISRVFAAADENPIPVTELVRQAFSLKVTSNGEIVGMETTPVATPNTSSGSLTIGWLIPEGTFVRAGQPVIRFDNTDAKLSLEKQENTLEANQQNTQIKTLQQGTEETVLGIDRKDAEEEYDYAMTVMPQDESIFSKWDIITAQADARYARERIEFLKSKGKTQQRIARSDQQILAIERNKAQSEISMIRQTLNSLELLAPVDGLVLYRRDRREEPKVGDDSHPGQVILEVINLDVLQARIYVLERDGGSLEKGQPVVIKLDAIPEKEFNGTITSVSSVASSLERNSPLRYFTCDVGIADAGGDLKRIRPGMNLRGDVILEKYESCFVVPSGAVVARESGNIVYVQAAGKFEERPVQTGLSSHGEAIILEGVEEGELIALADPKGGRKLYLPDFNKGGQQNGMPGMPGMPPGGMMRGMRGGPPR